MSTELHCIECGTKLVDVSKVCPACGAPPLEHRSEDDVKSVRTTDLEPYIALRYIALLFKVLAVVIAFMLIGEVVIGLMTEGKAAIVTLLAEATKLLVLGGLIWAAGDLAILLIDLGHDIRVSRILLGRINAEVHRRGLPGDSRAPSSQG